MTVSAILEVLVVYVIIPIIICLIIISLAQIVGRSRNKMPGKIGKTIDNPVCAIDADCPTGYVCEDGKCIPQSRLDQPLSPITYQHYSDSYKRKD